MDEAYPLTQRLPVPRERLDQRAKAARGVHRVQHYALVARDLRDQTERAVGHFAAVGPVITLEQVHRLRHLDGEAVAVDGRAHGALDVVAHALRR